jgi:hypothetical protein
MNGCLPKWLLVLLLLLSSAPTTALFSLEASRKFFWENLSPKVHLDVVDAVEFCLGCLISYLSFGLITYVKLISIKKNYFFQL